MQGVPWSFDLFVCFSTCVRANLTANFGIQPVFTSFGLPSFSFFLLNPEVISLISENQVNCLYNFLQITCNLTKFGLLIEQKRAHNRHTGWRVVKLAFYLCMSPFCLRCSGISKMTELICITFNNYFFPNSYQIISEIINNNSIIWLIFGLKLCPLFFKDRLGSFAQNPVLIIVKRLSALFCIEWWLIICKHIFVYMLKI